MSETVPPVKVPISKITINDSVAPTDYMLTVSNGGIVQVPWGNVVISSDQTDFYTSVESISASLVELTSEFSVISSVVSSTSSENDSVYTTVNTLSSGWDVNSTVSLQLLTFVSNASIGYTGGNTPQNNPIIVGFNGSYGASNLVSIASGQTYISTLVDNPCVTLQPGTYKVDGTLFSSCSGNNNVQYVLALFSSLPTIPNSKTYSTSNTPTSKLYSTLGSNGNQLTHFFNGYIYNSSVAYALLLCANDDGVNSTGTGPGVNATFSIYGTAPKYGGSLNLTYIAPTNALNITGSAIAVRPSY